MKRKIFLSLVLTLVLCLSLTAIAYAETKTIVLKIGDPNMTVNGVAKEIDLGRGTKPVAVKGRTLVPIRAILENIGGTVVWDDSTQQLTITANNKMIRLTIGASNADIKELNAGGNLVSKTLDVAPTVINGRTMVPLRFVSETLGGTVGWDGKTQTVTLTFNLAATDIYNWTGAWDSTEGTIVFQQIGDKVSSVSTTSNWGNITGATLGKTFKGKWDYGLESRGDLELTMSEDGKSFTGKYNFNTLSQPFVPDPEDPDAGWTSFVGERK